MSNNYWSATHDMIRANGGINPRCSCGAEMFPQDDHGRFICFSCSFGGNRRKAVPKRRPEDSKNNTEK